MTISYVGGASAESSSVTLFAHQAGDLLIGFAYRLSGTLPTVPSGWVTVNSNVAGGSRSSIVAYKVAASASETSGTWTNAEMLGVVGYRDSANYLQVGNSVRNSATGTGVRYGNLVSPDMPMRGSAWVVGMAACHLNSVDLEGTPTDMTNRITLAGASTKEIAIHDTNAAVTSYAYNEVTVSGSVAWQAYLLDVYDTGIALSSSGGGGPLIGPGGLVY